MNIPFETYDDESVSFETNSFSYLEEEFLNPETHAEKRAELEDILIKNKERLTKEMNSPFGLSKDEFHKNKLAIQAVKDALMVINLLSKIKKLS